jgi:hypothetical protein
MLGVREQLIPAVKVNMDDANARSGFSELWPG